MLPTIIIYIILFSLGFLFFKNYQQKIVNYVETKVKKVKENVEFYSVLYPIIWSKDKGENTNLIIYLIYIWTGIIIIKVQIFLAREVTNIFTNQSDESGAYTVPWGLLILTALLQMVKDSAKTAKTKQQMKMRRELMTRVQIKAFSKVHNMSIRWIIGKGFGEIKSLIDYGGDALDDIIRESLEYILPAVVTLVFSIVYISTNYSFWAAMIVLFVSIMLKVPDHFFYNWKIKARKRVGESKEDSLNRCMDSLSNFQTVKNFACEDEERARYRKLKETETYHESELEWWNNLMGWFENCLFTILSLGLTLYGANQISKGKVSYGDYVLLTSIFLELYFACHRLHCEILSIPLLCIPLDKTVALLNETPEVTDKKNARKIQVNTGRIEFKSVTFSYDKKDSTANESSTNDDAIEAKDKPALDDISFTVEAGESLALVGPSGSGKSTIAKVLTRMYNIDKGEILIDNENISEVTMKSLRRSIGIVPQEVELFNDTVIDNLRYGCPHATEEHVKEAASKAEIHAKIMKMENKYESKVGNKGMKLSGGERQRLGIARIFLKDPKIVILDEATSALDTITEKRIQESLEIANKGRTSLVIAHRLTTICNCDQIMVLDQGKMVEKGSHQELLQLEGMYYDMWNQQTEEEVEIEEDVTEEDVEDNSSLLKTIKELQNQVTFIKKQAPWYRRVVSNP